MGRGKESRLSGELGSGWTSSVRLTKTVAAAHGRTTRWIPTERSAGFGYNPHAAGEAG